MKIKAAVIDDAFSGEFTSYLSYMMLDPRANAGFENVYGGSFWEKKQDWLDKDVTFNADRIETPTLFSVHGEGALQDAVSTYSAFKRNRRPLEYILYPDATHQLVMPRQRKASIDLTVDWMSFWIAGIEDPNPLKGDQYLRWRQMREDWNRQQAWEKSGKPVGSQPVADLQRSGTNASWTVMN